ncbi:type VII secretion target [Actinopolymorpha pittospori]|uniref:Excreted virulence factor EspC, type VII ESX diderm n=1 Tax=Actinopolymorpha pittospori TaxID=648752 RepID=A0A927N369_9ACTN|nr:type VII secretion target [Actinopolymorpha pittospori]MBE1611486.1 hypothetical protein [Actinopolymorpha pittospori]
MVEVKVAIKGLKDTAADFEDMGKKLGAASKKADTIDLANPEFGYMGEKEGLNTAYAAAQKFLIDVLKDGAETMESVAKAVRTAAKAYEADEKAGVCRIDDAYGD